MMETLTQQLAAAHPLTDEQVRQAVEWLVDEKVPAAVKADFLIALAKKGETPGEIAAFARALRDKSIPVPLEAEIRAREILDVVGTGGDRLSTFNISTTVAIVAAAAGVCVAKHGNRASTSPIGSADVMEALGIPFDLAPEDATRSLRRHNFAYFFAPRYHPAFRHIAPVRKLCAERGQTTLFNFLGPLLNPARLCANRLPASCNPSACAGPWWFAAPCGMKPERCGISMNFRRWGRPRSPNFIRNAR
jgi:anthranilate phosphoribosyltransferase